MILFRLISGFGRRIQMYMHQYTYGFKQWKYTYKWFVSLFIHDFKNVSLGILNMERKKNKTKHLHSFETKNPLLNIKKKLAGRSEVRNRVPVFTSEHSNH